MKTQFLTRVVVAIFAVGSLASFAHATNTSSVQQQHPDPYGLRNMWSTDIVKLTINGAPAANQVIYFYGFADGAFGQPGVSYRYLGYAYTDRNGVARFAWLIPNDTHWSNVYLDAYYFGDGNTYGSVSEVRVRIGTLTPN